MKNSLVSTEIRSALSLANQSLSAARLSLSQAEAEKASLAKQITDHQTAKEIVRQIGLECQETVQQQINYVVTRCLQAIFGAGTYRFELVFEHKRNQTEARAILVDPSGNELDPLDSVGGGILDVVTFGLRLACLALMRPKPAQLLVLDEPFKFLSSQYREPAKDLILELTEELGTQVIMVSHIESFMDMGNRITIQ